MNVVVYGPQGCGKTRNADKICSHLNMDGHIDFEDLPDSGVTNKVIFTSDPAAPHDHTYDDLKQVIPSLV